MPRLVGVDLTAAEPAAADFIREHPDGCWLDVETAAGLLGHAGVPLPPGEVLTTVADTASGHAVGYPVVLMAADPQLVHKTKHCAVRTGIADAAQLSDAFVAVYRGAGGPVLVQRMAAHVSRWGWVLCMSRRSDRSSCSPPAAF